LGESPTVSGEENLPKWEILWGNYVQEEIERGMRVGGSTKIEDKDNFSLVGKGSKTEGKIGEGKVDTSHRGEKKKKYICNIKCFHCH